MSSFRKQDLVVNLINILFGEFLAADRTVFLRKLGDAVETGFVAAWDDHSFRMIVVKGKEADLARRFFVVFIWLLLLCFWFI